MTRGSRKPPDIYARRSFASLTIRGASALTALRQQAGVVETYNEKIMNPVHRSLLGMRAGVCHSPSLFVQMAKPPCSPRSFCLLPLPLPYYRFAFSILRLCLSPILSSPSSFFSAALMPLASLLYRVVCLR